MGSLAVDAISVLGTGITAYSFLESRLPEMRTQGATVEIRTSTGTNPATGVGGVEDTGGRVNRVWGYDAGNNLLGFSGGGDIGPGNKRTFKIDQGNNQQASYIDIVADNDPICTPIIGVTQPGDGLQFGWMGDVFKGCGLPNYYGNVAAGTEGYAPNCGWIDSTADASHEKTDAGSFKWYLPASSKGDGQDYSKNVDFYCHPRPFEVRYDAQPIEKRDTGDYSDVREHIRRSFKAHNLIISPKAQHPASALCEDPTTVGPDFVSLHEMAFCDMGNKKWYKLCDEENELLDNCFALDIVNRTLTGLFSHPKALGLVNELFSHDRVFEWD
ncbi:hypothetical protein KC320_g8485 [Hortaea werneckii]|nr:hypothetical protein KC320_g8485 [Hortaea werneckii]